MVPEYDIWYEAIYLTNVFLFQIKWQWVKDHQDDITISGLITYAPLIATAKVNVLCHKLATSVYNIPLLKLTSPYHINIATTSLTVINQRIHININLTILQDCYTQDI